uniref:Uncharacterized protein n=1 Tax=Arundo donax TaxID=35708 RepID=A0A0A9HLW7_ARUDO
MPPPLSSSPTVPPRLDHLMPRRSTEPLASSPGTGAAADPSPARGIGGTLLGTTGPKSSREDSEVSRVGFILDSGAAVHATGSADLLSERRAPGEGAFRTRAGKDLDVVAVGSVITPRFVVPEVRHVPVLGQGCTLISVRQLARRGLAVTFGSEFCDIRERSTGAVVGEGRLREEDGLYFMDYLRVPQS